MKNHIEIVKDIANGMLGIGGVPTDEQFYAEFVFRLKNALELNENGCNNKKKRKFIYVNKYELYTFLIIFAALLITLILTIK